ncbi:hypothetical protein GOP47_0002254 [Adiantum capillus-veneris]|uniref:GS catalytic domain-containing protein n=3 Tax=Euphyllophyta TaxID=78536 RepID=A0A9D4ZQT9_ADICA|nr:hypothetical protein GOP47_0002254 [Adiantum capillus-veneris]
MALTETEFSLLRERIYSAAIVDGHAHNLVDHHASSFPFLRAFTEADGDAAQFAQHTLSFKRSLRDIANLYGCCASLETVQAHRLSLTMEALCSKCLEATNLSAVLIDDGLHLDKIYSLDWHKSIFPNVYRVLRIETLAESIINQGISSGVKWTFDGFLDCFMSALKESSGQVVALKSIAAYRGGLNIDPHVSKSQAEVGFTRCVQSGAPIHIYDKNLVDFIFLCGLEVATQCGLPMQIHTGFGDKDLDLSLANPLHLRGVLEDKRFAKSRLVLLHASYPFSKEASYLSSVYLQVYLDFGLAIPKLSVKGMHSAVSELLELAPLNKVMFSTDGYAFPETFFLGIKWARETLVNVLGEACANGDLSLDEALTAASDILGANSMSLYRLSEPPENPIKQLSEDCYSRLLCDTRKEVKHVRLLWSDGSGQRRCRVVPKERFEKVTKLHGVGLAKCCMGMSSHVDGPAKGCGLNAVGEIRLLPDLRSKWVIPWSKEEELVLVDMHITPGSPWEYCPRSTLKRLSKSLLEEFGLVMKAGFESEFYILKRDSETKQKWVGLDTSPYCSSASFDAASDMLFEVSKALTAMGVNIEQLHAEAGCGQYEIALNYEPCLKAADDVMLLRETVKALIQRHGLIATFLPKLFPNDIGSGSHVHISLWEGDKNVFKADSSGGQYGMSKIGQEFMSGVYHHLPSILAFTAPLPNSYERIKPQTWSGAHHCWGRENREAPLRASCPPGTHHDVVSNFELKSFDGCANPHLGLAAILAAGIDGMQKHLQLPEPVDDDPSTLSEGLLKMLPTSLEQSVAALQQNEILKELLGPSLIKCIIAVRQSEIEFYKKQEDFSTMLAVRY